MTAQNHREPIRSFRARVDLRPRAFERTGAEVKLATGKRRRVNTVEYRTWKANAAEHLAAFARWRRMVGEVIVHLDVDRDGFTIRAQALPIPEDGLTIRRQSGLTGDVDNYAKAILDALQLAGVIANDQQVVELSVQLVPRTKGGPK